MYNPLSVCPSCEIPGQQHSSDQACFVAMKQFIKLLQDELEESRMQGFQHPTRNELVQELAYLEEQFEKFVIYTNAIQERIRNARRGSI